MEEYDTLQDDFRIYYYKKGTKIKHRLYGPAVEYYDNNYKAWYIDGLRHRENGPALIFSDGINKRWFYNGKLHRLDGPAVEYSDGNKEWWVNGFRLSKDKEKIVRSWYENGRI